MCSLQSNAFYNENVCFNKYEILLIIFFRERGAIPKKKEKKKKNTKQTIMEHIILEKTVT